MAPLRPVLRVLFDEAHQEAWTVRPEVAARMQPTHPADASYARAADLLRARRVQVDVHADGALGAGSPALTAAELDALEAHVNAGGGLVVLGESEQDKYGNNLNALLARFGVTIEHATVQDYERTLNATPSWARAELAEGERGTAGGGDLLAGVSGAVFYRAGT